jgi:membrane protease YdiL (CAAX protease family)
MRRSASRSDSKKHAASLLGAFLLAAALVSYNNLRPELGGLRYVGINLMVGAFIALTSITFLGSDPSELGLTGNRPRIVIAAGAAAVILVAPLFLLAVFDPTARWIADDRAADLDASELAFHVLVRIPLGTALFEEFVFRGALFGLLSRHGHLFGAIASSVPFGLWHIRPAFAVIHANAPDAGAVGASVGVSAAVLITTAAGLAFCWVRIKGRGIVAPFALHAALNSLALLAAALAHRQLA